MAVGLAVKGRQMSLHPITPTNADASPWDAASEANHRIANSLLLVARLVRQRQSSLRDNPRSMSADEVRLILEEFSGRLDTIARLHRLLAGGRHDASVDIAGY